MSSILATSPSSTRHFDASIATALGDVNAAIIVQQLHYWMKKKDVGVIVNGIKYVYNTFYQWVKEQFSWLSVWQFRKAMSLLRSLGIVKVIRYKSKQWNQTNYYTLDSDRLNEYLKSQSSQSIEISEMWKYTDQDENNQHLEMRDSNISYNETKNTSLDITTKQNQIDRVAYPLGNRQFKQVKQEFDIAAASEKLNLNQEGNQQRVESPRQDLTASVAQNNEESELNKQNLDENKTVPQVDYIVNERWRELIPLLDSTGIPVNKTVVNLLKMYTAEQVKGAIAIMKSRRRDQYIPNPSGYFVAALKQGWATGQVVENSESLTEVDTAAIFRHWYDLARELGYCSGQEIKEGEQWVLLSGSWEKWEDAVGRGYSLDYLKKIMKRNKNGQ
ncbi:hypothetical protein NIES4102_42160 (plasmid) [Chondrocystis sp. NIES-4102]|nr:hypothetical protein NIES4102_41110 [Chondrocystis sp. NIES-4102]BAZ47170.1 hypothetical protein NIES4102_42160 [Chondrocystis sp. NIES-4102]